MAQYNWPFTSVAAPVGGATSANQVLEIAALNSIDGKTPTVGQKTMAASSPVVIASDQSAVPISASSLPLPTGAATETTLAAINTKTPALVTGRVPVDGSGVTQPISASALPLPTGAATETTLAAMSAKLPATIGQKASAASLAVVIASDQPAIPVGSPANVISTANSTTTVLGISGVFTGTSEACQNYSVIVVNVFSDQVSAANGFSFQQSSNGTNWDILDVFTVPASTGKTYTFAPAAAFYRIVYTNTTVAQTVFRLQTVLHYNYTKPSSHSMADTITLQNDAELTITQMRATNGANTVAVTADATNVLQAAPTFAGVVAATGNGVAGTGTQRVTIASDNTPFQTKSGGKTVSGTARNDYTTTPVTTGAWVQLIASTAAIATQINIFDSSGQTLELGTGAAASETRLILIFPGGVTEPVAIAAGTRLSVRAVSANATVGEISFNLLN